MPPQAILAVLIITGHITEHEADLISVDPEFMNAPAAVTASKWVADIQAALWRARAKSSGVPITE